MNRSLLQKLKAITETIERFNIEDVSGLNVGTYDIPSIHLSPIDFGRISPETKFRDRFDDQYPYERRTIIDGVELYAIYAADEVDGIPELEEKL